MLLANLIRVILGIIQIVVPIFDLLRGFGLSVPPPMQRFIRSIVIVVGDYFINLRQF